MGLLSGFHSHVRGLVSFSEFRCVDLENGLVLTLSVAEMGFTLLVVCELHLSVEGLCLKLMGFNFSTYDGWKRDILVDHVVRDVSSLLGFLHGEQYGGALRELFDSVSGVLFEGTDARSVRDTKGGFIVFKTLIAHQVCMVIPMFAMECVGTVNTEHQMFDRSPVCIVENNLTPDGVVLCSGYFVVQIGMVNLKADFIACKVLYREIAGFFEHFGGFNSDRRKSSSGNKEGWSLVRNESRINLLVLSTNAKDCKPRSLWLGNATPSQVFDISLTLVDVIICAVNGSNSSAGTNRGDRVVVVKSSNLKTVIAEGGMMWFNLYDGRFDKLMTIDLGASKNEVCWCKGQGSSAAKESVRMDLKNGAMKWPACRQGDTRYPGGLVAHGPEMTCEDSKVDLHRVEGVKIFLHRFLEVCTNRMVKKNAIETDLVLCTNVISMWSIMFAGSQILVSRVVTDLGIYQLFRYGCNVVSVRMMRPMLVCRFNLQEEHTVGVGTTCLVSKLKCVRVKMALVCDVVMKQLQVRTV